MTDLTRDGKLKLNCFVCEEQQLPIQHTLTDSIYQQPNSQLKKTRNLTKYLTDN